VAEQEDVIDELALIIALNPAIDI